MDPATIALALNVCTHFQNAVTENLIAATAGDLLAQNRIELHQYACAASMSQAYGDVTQWTCLMHSAPNASAFCILDINQGDDDG
jgi:hypothetical protein